MKRRAYVSLLMAVIMLLTTVSGNVLAADAVIKVVPSATDLDIGQTVLVYLDIENITNLLGAEVHLVFDATRLEVVDANPSKDGVQIGHGDFLNPEFEAQNDVNNTTGVIDYAISQMGSSAVTGSGRLAIITFRTKASGTANISFTGALMAAPGGVSISVSMSNGSLVILADPTPEPPTPTPTNTPEGPTPTPSPTPDPTVEPSPTESPVETPTPLPTSCTFQGYHTVKPGETFYSIGRAYATIPAQIAACNGMSLSNVLYVGKVLGIPVAPWSPVPAGPKAVPQFTPGGVTPTPAPPAVCSTYHTVLPGETLTLIGWRYGVNIWDVARANDILNLNLIYAGQVLCIP